MKTRIRKIFVFSGLGLLALLGWIGFNTSFIWGDYLFGPPVRFRENREITVALYPGGAPVAAVLTNDDFSAATPLESVERLRRFLNRLEVRGTFFVIPDHLGRYPLTAGSLAVEMLEKLKSDGHEIAQHGCYHYSEKNRGQSVRMGAEMAFLSEEEQYRVIARGRRLLTELGFPPRGHRSPCFSGNRRTFRALDRLGYLYGSDLHLPPTTLKTILFPNLRRRLMYPSHPEGLSLLEINSQTDPTVKEKKAVKVFHRYRKRGGAFAFLTHLPSIAEPENLRRLERFVRMLQDEGAWICTMAELSEWWTARAAVVFRTGREGDTLIIHGENPTPFALFDLRISVKDPDLRRYRLVPRPAGETGEGEIPVSRVVSVRIPAWWSCRHPQ